MLFRSTLVTLCLVLAIASAAHAAVAPIRAESFQTLLQEHKYVLINFHAKWCPFSRKLGPMYAELSEELGSSVYFASVDVDEDKTLVNAEHVVGVPTLKLFRNGAFVAKYAGKLEKQDLKNWIESHLISIRPLDSCAARAARVNKKPIFVAFYKHIHQSAVSSAPVDNHFEFAAHVARTAGDKLVVLEHDDASRPLSTELGGSNIRSPAFALIDWISSDSHNFELRVRFFDDSKGYTMDSLSQWAVSCVEGKMCHYIRSSAPATVPTLSASSFDPFIQDAHHDVLVAFVDKGRVHDAQQMMREVRTLIGDVQSVRIAVVDVDSVAPAVATMTRHIGAKIVPSVWMFPASNKNRPSIAFVSLSDKLSPSVVARFAAQSASTKFELRHHDAPSNHGADRTIEVDPMPTWLDRLADIATVFAKWLGIYWLEL